MKPVYRTEMVVQVPHVGQKILPDYAASDLQRLINILKEERIDEAAVLLGVSRETIGVVEKISYKLPGGGKGFLKVFINVYQTGVIPEIAKGILDYLNKNQYVKDALEIEKKPLKALEREIQGKIEAIESLKNFVVNEIRNGRVKDLGFNPIDLDDRVIELKEKLNEVEKKMSLLRGYEMVVEPVVPQEPVKPDRALIVLFAFISSIFMGVFIAFFVEYIEKAKARRQAQ
jgi:hypothetical protein